MGMESANLPQQWRIPFGRRLSHRTQPAIDILILRIEQTLKLQYVGGGQIGEMRIGKPAQQQIHLPHATMAGAEADAAARKFDLVAVVGTVGHGHLPKAGSTPACGRVIAGRLASVSPGYQPGQFRDSRPQCRPDCIMRPSLLDPLFAPVSALSGVGPKTAKLFDRLLADAGSEARIIDLLFHLPHSLLDWRLRPAIVDAPIDQNVVLRARTIEHRPPPGRNTRAPFRVLVEDETGDVLLVFFLANHQWIERSLPIGETRLIFGRLEMWDGYKQMVHPAHVLAESDASPPLEPVYGLTEGLSPRLLRKAADSALARLPKTPDWLGDGLARKQNWPAFTDALTIAHHPDSPEGVSPSSVARTRLAYDELLSQQLALRLVRRQGGIVRGRASQGDGRIASRIITALPFTLTNAQREAIAEINADLASSEQMLRLLQGDVGSGKTLVALLAMTSVVEAGRQAAMMAPTEILARQHYARLAPMAEAAGMTIAVLTGRDKPAERARTLAALADGSINIVVGTHALVQDNVTFHDLGLAVIDEQHRFGVHQRLALGEKAQADGGGAADVLVMSATPIPRTLVLTYFGDMKVSNLREKPAGRQPIDTRAVPLERLDEVVNGLSRALDGGARVYWVCPLVAENEDSSLAAAIERADSLRSIYGDVVGLIHGQMKPREKDAAMETFQSGQTRILVATTVIEVGVDVPEASIMVIEHAERFGLAQLHQLRGRVGRGALKSSCVLLYKAPLGETAHARIAALRESEDGFKLAEEDLRLRGEGEILGTRQSGMPGFHFADLSMHQSLLPLARDDAENVLTADPDLTTPRGKALRVLLHLFQREEAVRLLRAG